MSSQGGLTSQAVAGRFGLHVTDLDCLDAVAASGELSAGELAKAVGLSSGATTALIDRLARAGYLERVPDPHDRRRIVIRAIPSAMREIEAVYRPMREMMVALWSEFGSEELATVADFLRRSTDLAIGCREEIERGPAPPKAPAGSAPGPRERPARRDR